jgi:16S rRNA processing protein RimM
LEGKRYYLFQLSGCSVVTREGSRVGLVKDVLFIDENDLLIVEKGERQVLVPFTESICVEVNLEERKITVDPPDGLLDLDEI